MQAASEVGGEEAKVLVSITEDPAGEGRDDASETGGGGGMLAGILKRESRESGRSVGGSSGKESSKFTATKFSSANIPGLKRKDKDKLKNGDAAPGKKEASGNEAKKRHRSNGRDERDGAEEAVRAGRKEQEQLQQLIEMRVISRPASLDPPLLQVLSAALLPCDT